jgi:L,D-transpeptidase catalytic domain
MGRASHSVVSYAGSRLRLVAALLLLLSVVAVLLAGCGPDAKLAASQNKSKLDAELARARTVAWVPAGRLAPIISQEDALATNTTSGQDSAYQAAASGYANLYSQVVTLESSTPSQAQAMTASDLNQLKASLATSEGSSIPDVVAAAGQFDPSVPQAQSWLASAKTVKDYFSVDGFVLDQLAAVTQLLPDYQQIQTLTKLVTTLTTDLGPAPAQPHVLECGTEGGEIASFGIDPAYFWVAQNNYPVNATNPVMVTPQVQSNAFYFSSWPSQALSVFKSASSADDFTVLATQVQAELLTLSADLNPSALAQAQVLAQVMRYQNAVSKYQSDVQANNAYLTSHRAKNKDVPDYNSVWFLTNDSAGYGPPADFYPNVPNFQVQAQFTQSAAEDANLLSQAKTTSDYLALSKTVQRQEQALSFPLLKAEAYYDTTTTLQGLVNEGQSTTTNVTFAGTLYKTPNAYEYADDDLRYNPKDTVGIQDAMVRLDQAAYREGNLSTSDSIADYQAIEDEAQMFIHNLSAMITNLAQMPTNKAARIAWSMTVHQTDLNLINYYGLQNTRVIVISLREQKARLFEDGKLVIGADGKPYAFDVTTGSPDKPTVPGLHCALPPLKGPPQGDIFKSADPPGSPFYYKPTPVHYSFGYSLYGYFMHDGWWRDGTEMGYLTNLPHFDPEAFNGGSHGCINFHYANGDMGKVYAFSSTGIPIIVY